LHCTVKQCAWMLESWSRGRRPAISLSYGQTVHIHVTHVSVSKQHDLVLVKTQWCSEVGKVTTDLKQSMAGNCLVYDQRLWWTDCTGLGQLWNNEILHSYRLSWCLMQWSTRYHFCWISDNISSQNWNWI